MIKSLKFKILPLELERLFMEEQDAPETNARSISGFFLYLMSMKYMNDVGE